MVQPRFLLITVGILLVLFAGFVIFENHRTNRDVLSMMREQGALLLDALDASGQQSIMMYETLQNQIIKQMIDQAYRVAERDQHRKLSMQRLRQLSQELKLSRIQIFDRTGHLRMTTHASPSIPGKSDALSEWIQPLLNGKQDTLVIGLHLDDSDDGSLFAVGVRHAEAGAVVVSIEAQRLSSLRREMGPGRLVQEIGNQPGVVYVALQDTLSIILASRAVSRLSRIQSDDFLQSAWRDESRQFRFVPFQEQEVFEAVGPFRIHDERLGLFRIGLNTTHYHQIRKNARLRTIMLGVLAAVLGMVSIGFLAAQQNIRLIDRAYRRFRSQSSEILQNLEDAVVAVDARGEVTVFNRAAERILNVPQKKRMGRSIETADEECLSVLAETLRMRRPIHRSEYACRIGDDERILSLHTSILFSGDQIEAAILVITDISEQKRLEFRVRQQEKFQAMGRLAAAVAHEIRNPINAIGMIAQRIRKEFRPESDDGEYDGLVQSILDEVRRTNRIVQQFLRFARPKPLSFQTVSSRAFLQDVIRLFKSSAEMSRIRFDSSIREDVQIEIDPDQMRQALLNLLQNALQASGPGGRIGLSGRLDDRDYVITVQDDGPGISAEDQKRIFDLYFTTRADGTGLGLPITLQIIQAHHGTIDLESRETEGALFRIRLPIL